VRHGLFLLTLLVFVLSGCVFGNNGTPYPGIGEPDTTSGKVTTGGTTGDPDPDGFKGPITCNGEVSDVDHHIYRLVLDVVNKNTVFTLSRGVEGNSNFELLYTGPFSFAGDPDFSRVYTFTGNSRLEIFYRYVRERLLDADFTTDLVTSEDPIFWSCDTTGFETDDSRIISHTDDSDPPVGDPLPPSDDPPTPTPTPSPSPSISPSPSPSVSPSPSPSPAPTGSPSPSVSPSMTGSEAHLKLVY
jgi:hypothetical protein